MARAGRGGRQFGAAGSGCGPKGAATALLCALAACATAAAEGPEAAPPPDARPAAIAPEPAPAACPPPCTGPATAPRPPRRPADLGGMRRARVIGVLETQTGRAALIRVPGGRILRVGEGSVLRGWRVTAIDADGVRLARRGQRLGLPLLLP